VKKSQNIHKISTSPLVSTLIWGDYGTAPTEGRFARPERRWGCRRGTPTETTVSGGRMP